MWSGRDGVWVKPQPSHPAMNCRASVGWRSGDGMRADGCGAGVIGACRSWVRVSIKMFFAEMSTDITTENFSILSYYTLYFTILLIFV